MSQRIQIRRDTSLNWTSVDPILAQAELGYETDSGLMKVGDGTNVWSALAYYGAVVSGSVDHGILAGLSDDDHPQYFNTTRGDDRYYTETEIDYTLTTLSGNIVSQIPSDYYTQSQVNTISGVLSSEIDSDIAVHTTSSGHDNRYYTESEMDYKLIHRTPGIIGDVNYTNNGSGNISIPNLTVLFNMESDFSGSLVFVSVSGTNINLPDSEFISVVVKYNNGTPIFDTFTLAQMPQINVGDVALYASFYRCGEYIICTKEADGTVGLSNKMNTTMLASGPVRSSVYDFLPSISGSNYLNISGGTTFFGAYQFPQDNYDSYYDTLILFYNDGSGGWNYTISGSINNMYYDDGDGLVELTTGKYVNNWVYKIFSEDNSAFYIIGNQEYNTLQEALVEDLPQSVPQIENMSFLTARITTQKGVIGGYVVSAYTKTFAGISKNNHNVLDNLQGGADNEYYHLTYGYYLNLIGGTPDFETVTVSAGFYGDGSNIININHTTLSGLDNDDHPQYLTSTRGDERYYTQLEVLSTVSGIVSNSLSEHSLSGDHDNRYFTKEEVITISGVLDSRRTTNEDIQDAIGTSISGVGFVYVNYDDINNQITISGMEDINKLNTTHVAETTDKHPYLTNALSTGLCDGGILSINSEDDTKFDVTAGWGMIVNNYSDASSPVRKIVTWPTTTGISDQYIGYATTGIYVEKYTDGDGVGTISQQDSFTFTDDQKKDVIILGYTVHPSTTIANISNKPYYIPSIANQVYDFMDSFGAFNVDGNYYTTLSGLYLERSAGSTFEVGSNYSTSAKQPNIIETNLSSSVTNLYYFYRTVSGTWNPPTAPINYAVVNYYDTGSGIVNVPSGYWTAQPIMYRAVTGLTGMQYGQDIYIDKDVAISSINDPIEINPLLDSATLRGWLVVQEGTTDLTDTDKAAIINADKFGTISSSGGSVGGETNTYSNSGLSGVSVILTKTGVDLPFKAIDAGSNKISVTNDATNKTVDIDVTQSNLDHGSIGGLGDDDHTQYHNDARGDARYYTQSQIDTLSGTIATSLNNHKTSSDHDGRYYTEAEVDSLVITDHGVLGGLLDDDHTQYSLINGNRAFTGVVSGVTPTAAAHLATKEYVDTHGNAAVVQVRRTTNITLTTSFANVTFDTVDVENYSDIIHRDATSTDRVYVYETGMYQINYGMKALPTVATTYLYGKVVKNDTTDIPGTYDFVDIYTNETHDLENTSVVSLTTGDYVSLQVSRSAAGAMDVVADTIMTVIKQNAIKGDKGDTGSGSSIIIKDNGSIIPNSPSSILDFEGVTIDSSVSGTATIANVFGSYNTNSNSETLSTTTSTSWQQKLRLTTPSLTAGTYRVGWYYEWYYTSASSNFQAQVQIDDTTTIMSHVQEPQDAATSQSLIGSGFYIGAFTSGAHNIDLDYRSSSGFATAGIKNVRLEFWRIS